MTPSSSERTLIFFFVVVVFLSGVVEDVTEAALFAALALFSKGEYGEPNQPVQSVELNYNIAVHNGVVLTECLATRIRSHKFTQRPFITAKFSDLDLKGFLPLASTAALEWNNRAGGKLQLKAETLPAS